MFFTSIGAMIWGLSLRAIDRRWHMRELLHGALAGLAGASAGVGYACLSVCCCLHTILILFDSYSAPYASMVVGVLCSWFVFDSLIVCLYFLMIHFYENLYIKNN